jgi:rhodanese-related sulfurtransferase
MKKNKTYNNISDICNKKGEKDMLHKYRYLLNRNRCYCKTEISSKQLEKMIEQGAILVDVRSPQEFAEGHIKNAISLPEYEIKEKSNNLLPNKAQLIIVYCSTGHRSKKAQTMLEKLGYEKVYNLCNGLENYN